MMRYAAPCGTKFFSSVVRRSIQLSYGRVSGWRAAPRAGTTTLPKARKARSNGVRPR